jgi:hypothetical protein
MTDRDLDGIEQGVPLCVAGLNVAVTLASTRPNLPDWVRGILPLTREKITTLREEKALSQHDGNFQLQLI